MTISINSLDAERAFFQDFFGVGHNPGFGCQLRKAAAEAIMAAYEKETDEDRKKLLVVNLHQQVCLTFEDIGAVMLAIERKLSKGVDFLETYLLYRPGEAYISEVLSGKSDTEILETFGFGEELEEFYNKYGIPRPKLWEWRRTFLRHVKSVADTQNERKTICNKTKHGAVILSRGGEILRGVGDPQQLCALSLNKDKATNLYQWTTESFRYSNAEVRFWFQLTRDEPELLLKPLAFQYVIRFHPDLRPKWFTKMGLT